MKIPDLPAAVRLILEEWIFKLSEIAASRLWTFCKPIGPVTNSLVCLFKFRKRAICTRTRCPIQDSFHDALK